MSKRLDILNAIRSALAPVGNVLENRTILNASDLPAIVVEWTTQDLEDAGTKDFTTSGELRTLEVQVTAVSLDETTTDDLAGVDRANIKPGSHPTRFHAVAEYGAAERHSRRREPHLTRDHHYLHGGSRGRGFAVMADLALGAESGRIRKSSYGSKLEHQCFRQVLVDDWNSKRRFPTVFCFLYKPPGRATTSNQYFSVSSVNYITQLATSPSATAYSTDQCRDTKLY